MTLDKLPIGKPAVILAVGGMPSRSESFVISTLPWFPKSS